MAVMANKMRSERLLGNVREAITRYQEHGDATLALFDIIENFNELDQHLKNRGMLPNDWRGAF